MQFQGCTTSSAPALHSVHFYDNDDELLDRLRRLVASGLHAGNSVVLVTTEPHRLQLVSRLSSTGVDLATAARAGRLTLLDASDALSGFMREDRPDEVLFRQSIGSILDTARKASRTRALTVFGEMVSVLWQDGHKEAALQLETLWNSAISERAFHLHCAYPRRYFTWDEDGETRLQQICAAHTHCYQVAPEIPTGKPLLRTA